MEIRKTSEIFDIYNGSSNEQTWLRIDDSIKCDSFIVEVSGGSIRCGDIIPTGKMVFCSLCNYKINKLLSENGRSD